MTRGDVEDARAALVRGITGVGGMVATLLILVVFFSLRTENFLSAANLRTVANQIPTALTVAVGMTFVLVSGGIDLSVGSVLSLSSAVLGVCLTRAGMPLPVALMAAVLTGAACGAANGLIVAHWRIPSFIVTLGMLEAARGGAYLVTDSRTQYIGATIDRLGAWSPLGLSAPFFVALAVVGLAHVALTQTPFGRRLAATGYNEEVARLAGTNVFVLRVAVFTLSGFLAGVAAIIHTARLSAADPNAGIGFELDAIAAVVIGGTSLSGGRGSVLRSALGVLIIAVLGSGLAQAGAQDSTKRLVAGLVIVVAVIMDRYRKGSRSGGF